MFTPARHTRAVPVETGSNDDKVGGHQEKKTVSRPACASQHEPKEDNESRRSPERPIGSPKIAMTGFTIVLE